MKSTFALLALALAPGLLLAQTRDDTTTSPRAPQGWSLGIAVAAADSPYVGEGTRVLPFPMFAYEGERVFLRGISGGVHLLDTGAFQLDALVSARLDGFDIDDLDAGGLAANGLDARLLDDRDHGLDVGVGAAWSGSFGRVRVRALADVTDASGGQEVGVEYAYPVPAGAWMLVPSVGVEWMSDDLANYYFGTLDSEVARGVPRYDPGAAVVPSVGIAVTRPLGERWTFLGGLDYKFLPDELADSPLLERGADGIPAVFGGVSYRF
ncbi:MULTISPECIES: MipA/OmpV family protein [Luteimonas]|uniref:MipA/OmpV family protein n=1 Tax=Luteimonas TaxID=83614 RepID=UPI000C7DDA30|nr:MULTISPECIES: MipA/OmpV family protein [Luteimonas]